MKLHYTLTPEDMLEIYNIYMKQPNARWRINIVSILMGFAFSVTYLLQPAKDGSNYLEKLQTSPLYVGGIFVIGFLFGQLINFWNVTRQRRRLKKYQPIEINATLSKEKIEVQSMTQDIELSPEEVNDILISSQYIFLFYKENRKRGTIVITKKALKNNEDQIQSIIQSWSKKFEKFIITKSSS